jgi:hypothetical protein
MVSMAIAQKFGYAQQIQHKEVSFLPKFYGSYAMLVKHIVQQKAK